MFRDAQLEFSVAQAVTASAPSTNVVDTIAPGDAIGGSGSALYLMIRAVSAGTAGGAATVDFQLQSSTDPAFGSFTVMFDSGAIPVASLTANTYLARVAMPLGELRYMRVYYTVATGPLTGGTFDAFITKNIDLRR